MAALSEPAEHEVIETAILGARIIDPEIVDGRIVGGRIVGAGWSTRSNSARAGFVRCISTVRAVIPRSSRWSASGSRC